MNIKELKKFYLDLPDEVVDRIYDYGYEWGGKTS